MGPIEWISSLFTRSTKYAGPRALPLGDSYADGVERQIVFPTATQTRWLLSDLETAILTSDRGNMRVAGRLWKSIRRDGVVHGVLSTRTEGLVQLPIRFRGSDPDLVASLESEFRTVFPSAELALLSADGRGLGLGVGEFVQANGARLPVLRRLDPEALLYQWSEDRWYYQTIRGLVPVNPGDGRWVLHCPGGSVQPWTQGLWMALGRAFIAKEHAYFYRENYSSKLANAARVAVAPQGASEEQKQSWFRKVMAWGVNTVFGMTPGYDVKLLESNGRGYEVFRETIEDCNQEIQITLAGQTVTTDGGTGFSNADIHKAIRADLIQADADALAATINAQGIPVWANERFGAGALDAGLGVSWDVTPPKEQNAEAATLLAAANAVKVLNEVLAPYGQAVDIEEIARRFGVPVQSLGDVVSIEAHARRRAAARRARIDAALREAA